MHRDLELPGLPMIRIGILFMMHTKLVNKLSMSAELNAIFSPADLN
jgi:hypothetical protein